MHAPLPGGDDLRVEVRAYRLVGGLIAGAFAERVAAIDARRLGCEERLGGELPEVAGAADRIKVGLGFETIRHGGLAGSAGCTHSSLLPPLPIRVRWLAL